MTTTTQMARSSPFEDGCTEEMVSAQLRKILQSAVFGRSRRLRRFLRFSVEQTLLQQTENLKEYSIGLEVFEKPESFDPRMDSIVRVVARRLRMLVERYYQSEGAADPVIIGFHSGSYVPHFRLRSAQALDAAAASPPPRTSVQDAPILLVANDDGAEKAESVAGRLGMSVVALPQDKCEELLRRVLLGQAQVYAVGVTAAAGGVLGMPAVDSALRREPEAEAVHEHAPAASEPDEDEEEPSSYPSD